MKKVTIKNIWGMTPEQSVGQPITKENKVVGTITSVDESYIYAEVDDDFASWATKDNKGSYAEFVVAPTEGGLKHADKRNETSRLIF